MPASHPNELHGLFVTAFVAKDIDAVLSLYEPAAVHLDLDGCELSGKQTLRAFFDGLLQSIEQLESSTRKVTVVGDVALTSATWKGTGRGPDGSILELRGTTAEISRRQPDGTWLFVVDDATFV